MDIVGHDEVCAHHVHASGGETRDELLITHFTKGIIFDNNNCSPFYHGVQEKERDLGPTYY